MFPLLTWLLILGLIFLIISTLKQLIPTEFVTKLGWLFLLAIAVLAFVFPRDQGVFTAWNILSLPLRPVGFAIIGLWIAYTGIKNGGITSAAMNAVKWAFPILLFFSFPYISYGLEYSMIRSNVPTEEVCPSQGAAQGIQAVDAIVFLPNTISQPGQPYRPSRQVLEMSDRIFHAANEYNRQRAIGNRPLVLISARPARLVGSARAASLLDEAQLIREQLLDLGVPARDIENLPEAFDLRQTTEGIKTTLESILPLAPYRITIVASALDVGRAKLTLEKTLEQQGVRVIASAPDLSLKLCGDRQEEGMTVYDWIPSAKGALRSTKVVNEFLSNIYYFFRGWLTPCWDCWDSGTDP